MFKTISLLALMLLSQLAFVSTTFAYNGIKNKCPKNCYPIYILRVIDGDSIQGYIHTNDKESVIFATFRLEGIDTPEVKKSQCLSEELLGMKASKKLKKIITPIIQKRSAKKACACNYHQGKYANRRVGTLKIKNNKKWLSVARPLKTSCFAVTYSGKGKRPNWCDCLNKGICPSQYFSPKCAKQLPKKKNKYKTKSR